jgi:hypothetical protein
LVIRGILPDHLDPGPAADKERSFPQSPEKLLHFLLGILGAPKPRIGKNPSDLSEDAREEAKLVAFLDQSQNLATHPSGKL